MISADSRQILEPELPRIGPHNNWGCHQHRCQWCGFAWFCAMAHDMGRNPTPSCHDCRFRGFAANVALFGKFWEETVY